MRSDIVIIGSGISGYLAAYLARRSGASVTIVTSGMGGLTLSQGTIDVMGRIGGSAGPAGGKAPLDKRSERRLIEHPLAFIASSEDTRNVELPDGHPYRVIGSEHVSAGLAAWERMLGPDYVISRMSLGDTPTVRDDLANYLIPTAVGAIRPTFLIPPSMRASILTAGKRYVVAGLARHKDFFSTLVAGNLARTLLPDGSTLDIRAVTVDADLREGQWDVTSVQAARAFDDQQTRERLARSLEPHVSAADVLLLPAILGLHTTDGAQWLAERLGIDVGEVPLVPPNPAGIRWEERCTSIMREMGVRILSGARVVGVRDRQGEACQWLMGRHSVKQHVQEVVVDMAGRERTIGCDHLIDASGGFESGALACDSYSTITDTVLGLPVCHDDKQLVHRDYWGKPQRLFASGIAVDDAMRPLGTKGQVLASNVHVVGGKIAGAMRWSEKSGDGIALGSVVAALEAIGVNGDETHV
ncbi:glycerol-3-phosphate dehydrogenase subunit GlpB [Actinomyces vulturis]|uniref:glycerol-3-phosphate dehydrogenase subunit GlpB n=1 Tax=Actinomyces vulturis TaxID=1857645 RepID=UPI0008339434|nr:glycerol-3-phosphate dehydrogenase subunit GlpB [Actinomyces vulturis]